MSAGWATALIGGTAPSAGQRPAPRRCRHRHPPLRRHAGLRRALVVVLRASAPDRHPGLPHPKGWTGVPVPGDVRGLARARRWDACPPCRTAVIDRPTSASPFPRVPASHVERPRLIGLLDEAAALPLTLIGAPAGSGKTALAAAWSTQRADPGLGSAGSPSRTATRGPSAFWPLVGACLSATGVDVPRPPRGGLCDPPRHAHGDLCRPGEGARADHLGPRRARGRRPGLGDDIAWVLSHTGHRLRLVILTRVDPLLPLHRFRLADAMAELRVGRSRLHPREAARLIEASGSILRPESVDDAGRPHPGVGGRAALRRPASRRRRGPGPRRRRADGRLRQHRGVPDVRGAADPASGRSRAPAAHQRGRRAAARALRGAGWPGRSTPAWPSSPTPTCSWRSSTGQPGWYRYHPFLKDLLRAELAFASPRLTRRLRPPGGALVRRRRRCSRGRDARGGLGMVGRRGGVRRGRPGRGRADRRRRVDRRGAGPARAAARRLRTARRRGPSCPGTCRVATCGHVTASWPGCARPVGARRRRSIRVSTSRSPPS